MNLDQEHQPIDTEHPKKSDEELKQLKGKKHFSSQVWKRMTGVSLPPSQAQPLATLCNNIHTLCI